MYQRKKMILKNGDYKEIVFEPVKGTSQELALDSRCDETLLCGTRGSMKTATQLIRIRMNVGIGYGAFWKCLVYDREFKNLTDIVAQAKKFYLPFGDCHFTEGTTGIKCKWKTGEVVEFRHLKRVSDYMQIHGMEFPGIFPNEITNHPNAELYDKILSTNRSSFVPEKHTPRNKDGSYATADGKPLPRIPLQCFATCNPSGVGHNWVKSRFIKPAPYGTVVRKEVPVFNPQTKKEEIYTKTQIAIFSSYRENPYLDPAYVAKLASIRDPNLKLAWEGGSWAVTCGGAVDDLWRDDVHVVEDFKIPDNWYLDRSFDWGSSTPFAVTWFAEANGESITLPSGKEFTPNRGSLICFNEWYGTDDITTNEGLKLSAYEVANGILDEEKYLFDKGWISSEVNPGAADNQISQTREKDVETIEKKMADNGVLWLKSDKSKGSRKNGLQLLREMLESSLTGEGAGIYFMRKCVACIETIPSLPRDLKDIDDVDKNAIDHLYDAVKYRVLQGQNRLAEKIDLQVHT
jgi:hypothetical protein